MHMPIVCPTSLTKIQVKQFQKIYFNQFGDHLTVEEAYDKGLHLVQFVATVWQLVEADFTHDTAHRKLGKASSSGA